jgi:ArsR family transcriptional regulator, arsenate/arsenite/antimonite-responsive transcriptional repressor
MRQLEAVLKAAGDPTRTRILKLLEIRDLCVCQIQAVLRLAPSTISKHLSLLKASGLVDDRKDGRWVHYALASEDHNPYAKDVLRLIRGALVRDPKILEDGRRLKDVLKVPVADLCALIPAERIANASPRRSTRRSRGESPHA